MIIFTLTHYAYVHLTLLTEKKIPNFTLNYSGLIYLYVLGTSAN